MLRALCCLSALAVLTGCAGQAAAPAPTTEPNAPITSGSETWLLFMIVVRRPSASPTRPAGARSCSSDATASICALAMPQRWAGASSSKLASAMMLMPWWCAM